MHAGLFDLHRTIFETDWPYIEAVAIDLEKAANEVKKKAKNLKDRIEAISLLSDLVKLVGSLALAFG